jgi:hypothetical protein
MLVKFGNTTKDVPILEVNAANYIVPKGEEGTVHCRIEQVQFNPNTGVRQSRPRIQKFEPKSWPGIQRILRQQGWTIDILYDPTAWLKEKEEKERMSIEERVRLAQEAEVKKKAEMKAALKAEILAELKEAGVIKSEFKSEESDDKKETKGGSKKK